TAATELMEAGMPVDKAGLVKILSQSMKYPEASMQTLVSLNKMNIPVTEANIAQYERYQSYSHQLSGDIGQAADSMASFTEAFPAGTPGAVLLSTAGEILDMFMQDMAKGEETILNPEGENRTAGQSEAGAAENLNTGEKTVVEAESVISKENSTVLSGEQAVEFITNAEDKTVEETGQNIDKQSVKISEQEVTGQSQKTVAEAENRPADTLTADREEVSRAGEKKADTGNTELGQFAEKAGLSREEAVRLTNTLQKAGLSREEITNIQRQADSPEKILKAITQALSGANADDAVVRELLQSNEFKKLFSDMIKKNWALNPKDMKDPKEIDELYDKIMKQSKGFEDTVAAKGGDAKSFNQNFQNMRQNMQFMEQLNNQMIYAQMPLKLSNQNANSELYVYADKRKLMEKKDGISVMLHLDMDHLGMTDIKVTLTGSNVNARFYLNDQQSVDIVTNNMAQLAKQLADRGFSLTNEVVKRQPQESINKVVDEIVDENAERSIKRYTFDART
ncbi:MAG: flagellar hook-length control protein FliK, partial [Lachnospiraceae bacterium]|nr:flagellar hook-length control protein FliK [Lachnospiraceae bacterium]